jgi:tetratricopeptide (TPR) repeat protein
VIKALAWFEVNKKRIAIGAAAALLLIVFAIVLIQQHADREIRASEALSDVRVPARWGDPALTGVSEAYLKVAREHAGTKAGGRALLLGASTLYVEGRYKEAQAEFERFLREYPESPWLSQAALGVASCLDAQDKSAEAMQKYEEFRRRFASDTAVDEAKLALGRLYDLQGKNEEAYKLYDEVLKAGMAFQSGIAMEAGARQEDLVKRFPELAKLRAPIIPPGSIPPSLSATTSPPVRATGQVRTVITNPIRFAGTNAQAQATAAAAKAAVSNAMLPATNVSAAATSAPPLLVKPAIPTNK